MSAAPQAELGERLGALERRLAEPEARREAGRELLALARALEQQGGTAALGRSEAYALARAAALLAALEPEARPEELDPQALLASAARLAAACGDAGVAAYAATKEAESLRDHGHLADAEQRARMALEALGTRAPDQAVPLWLVCAQVARAEGRLDEALAAADEAEAAAGRLAPKDRRRPLARANVLGVRVELFLALGLADLAAGASLEEVELARALGGAYRGRALRHRVAVLLAQSRHEALEQAVEQALAEPALFPGPTERAGILLCRALSRAERARLEPGLGPVADAELAEVLAVPGLPAADRASATLARVELAQRRGALAESAALLDAAAGLGELSEGLEGDAWLAALRHRQARLALDPQALRTSAAALERAWTRFLERWRSLAPRPGGLGFLKYGTRRFVIAEVVRAALVATGDEAGRRAALERVLEAQALGTFARRAGYVPEPFEVLRASLTRDDRGCLLFLPGYDGVHVFAFDARGIAYAELAAPPALEALRRAWVELLLDPPPGATRTRAALAEDPRGRALADALLPAPVRARLAGWRAVTVVSPDLAGYLPFEFLPFEGGFLGDARAVSYLPSLPVGALLAGRTVPDDAAGPAWALVAAPELGEAFEPLVLAPGALEDLTGGSAAERSWTALGPQATRDALRDPRVARARVLHLYTHGVVLPDRERYAALALAPASEEDDGIVDCAWIEAHVAAPPLVIVSACRAAAGPTRSGDDVPAHLGGAFLAAGARCVLVAPVPLAAETQQRLVAALGAGLRAGATVDEALRQARAALARDPSSADPRLALVHAVGLGDTVPFPRAPR